MKEFTEVKKIISTLTALLTHENEQIRKGNYKSLNVTGKKKAVYMKSLEKALFRIQSKSLKDNLRPSLEMMQKQASVNAVLLSSAINGVKSANDRINTIMDRERNTGTYDRNGRSVRMGNSRPLKIKVL